MDESYGKKHLGDPTTIINVIREKLKREKKKKKIHEKTHQL